MIKEQARSSRTPRAPAAEWFSAPGWIDPGESTLRGREQTIDGSQAPPVKSPSLPASLRAVASETLRRQVVGDRHEAAMSAPVLRVFEWIESP